MWQEFVVNIIATPGKTQPQKQSCQREGPRRSRTCGLLSFSKPRSDRCTPVRPDTSVQLSDLMCCSTRAQACQIDPQVKADAEHFVNTCACFGPPWLYYPVCQFHQQIRICKNTAGPHRETGEEFQSHTLCRSVILPTVKWHFCAICQWAKLDSLKRSYY